MILSFRSKISYAFEHVTVLICIVSTQGLGFRQNSAAQPGTISIRGSIRDAVGVGIDAASVTVQSEGQLIDTVKTRADGSFALSAKAAGSFSVRVEKAGFGSTIEQLTLNLGEVKYLEIVLQKVRAEQDSSSGSHSSSVGKLEFDEKPSFTIAGITDWSGAGGHGSDVSLRTSESLARETRSLDGRGPDAEKTLASSDLLRERERVQQLLAKEDRADLHRRLGDLDEQLNDPLAAVREYERGVSLGPSEENYFAWGTELLIHKGVQPAVEVFSKGAAAHPDSARMLAGLGAALYAAGSYDEAARKLCEAADRSSGNSAPYLFLGKMQKAGAASLPCVEQKLEQFVRLQPTNALAHYYYALALWKRNRGGSRNVADFDRIEKILSKAAMLDPTFAEVRLQLGILYTERGESERALNAYQRAVEADPNLAAAHYKLAQAYKKIGEQSKAQEEFRLYERTQKAEAVAVERQRRELRQFLVVMKEQPGVR